MFTYYAYLLVMQMVWETLEEKSSTLLPLSLSYEDPYNSKIRPVQTKPSLIHYVGSHMNTASMVVKVVSFLLFVVVLMEMLLQIPPNHVKVLDHPDLQDGFGSTWNSDVLAKIISKEIDMQSIDLIITFDNYGVSGHCNHRDVHQGVIRSLHEESMRNVEVWELVSTNILRKYSGAIDIWLSIFFAKYQGHPDFQLKCLLNENPRKTYAAMAQHKSQWIWFRKLFVAFSSYTYVNTLKKIK
ncbi:hypothetical protein Leryth_008562 [Lithospermum erythrorhizon]|nr:hypothetical protein Leryth_008562 [Lithospermum erythrorhizon]